MAEGNRPSDDDFRKVMALTGVDEVTAQKVLEESNGDMTSAINKLLDDLEDDMGAPVVNQDNSIPDIEVREVEDVEVNMELSQLYKLEAPRHKSMLCSALFDQQWDGDLLLAAGDVGVRVHSALLRCLSPKLNNLLASVSSCSSCRSTSVIHFDETSPAGLRTFVQLLYKGEVNEPLSQELEAYDLAKLFGLNVSFEQKQSSNRIEENHGGSPTAEESNGVDGNICQVEGTGQEEGTSTGQDDERMEEQVREEDGKVKCDKCGKDIDRKSLVFHEHAVHREDAYAYKCKETGCGQRYYNLLELWDHRRVAHGFPKKRCNVEGCGTAFLLYSEYVRHCGTHSNKVECDECGKMLSPSYITEHKRRMHKRENYSNVR